MRFSSGRVLHFKTRALLSNCGTRTCHPLFSTRARMFPCLHYTRVHVALSSLHACACCTVLATRVCMLHCPRYTRVHVALCVCMLCFQAKSPRCTSECLSLLCSLKHGEMRASFIPKNTISWYTNLLCFLAQRIFPSLHAVFWPAI